MLRYVCKNESLESIPENMLALEQPRRLIELLIQRGIDTPEKAKKYRDKSKPQAEDTCSMCGNFCAVRNVNRILNGEIVSIYEE